MSFRIYPPNWAFWKEWSGDLAYVLGIFCADGNMHKGRKKNLLQMTLKSEDRYLLERICNQAGGYVGDSHTCSFSYWRINGRDIVSHLKSLGVAPRSRERDVLPEIPSEFLPDFVRGYFDGDGCAGIYLNGRKEKPAQWFMIAFAGRDLFLTALRECIGAQIGSDYIRNRTVRKLDADVYEIRLSKRKEVLDLGSWMQTNSRLFLKRKRSILSRMENIEHAIASW